MSVYSLIQVQGFLLAAFITRKHVRMDSQELVLVKDDQHSVLRYGLVLILLADDDARWQAAHGCIIASSLPTIYPGRYHGLHLGPHLGH